MATRVAAIPRVAGWLAAAGIMQAGVGYGLAVSHYPGGSPWSRSSQGFRFLENTISDLGLTRSWSCVSNPVGSTWFNSTVLVFGLSLVPFFWGLRRTAPDQPRPVLAAALLGTVSSLALAAIGLTPYDIRLECHNASLVTWLVTLLVALVLHVVAIFRSEHRSRRESWPAFVLLGLMVAFLMQGAYFFTLVYPGRVTLSHGTWIAVIVSENLLVAAFCFWVLYWGVWAGGAATRGTQGQLTTE